MTGQPRISRSEGQTPTETFLAQLCDRTFLKLWSYANPFNKDGKELCDLIAIFDNHVFVFFDRESKRFKDKASDVLVTWERWRKEVIEKQIKTAHGAHRYILTHSDEIYLDSKRSIRLPLNLPATGLIFHKIIVAHGAAEACKEFSSDNISGSLAISYGGRHNSSIPFLVNLDRLDPVHVFDSHNLEIILSELDTVYDFASFLAAKEEAIKKYESVIYCGEEDLLAHYFFNFDGDAGRHFIGIKDGEFNAIFIEEGEWGAFSNSEPYKRKKLADKSSYLWDALLQLTTQNALDGTLKGNADLFSSQSAIFEMAKEPRFSRRALSDHMRKSVVNFPDGNDGMRHLSAMPSYYGDKYYVFLQIKPPQSVKFDDEYRAIRTEMLKIACGVAKNKLPQLMKVIGIAIDAPKFARTNAEDFVLLDCEDWSDETRRHFEEANQELKFFETSGLKKEVWTVKNFPDEARPVSESYRDKKRMSDQHFQIAAFEKPEETTPTEITAPINDFAAKLGREPPRYVPVIKDAFGLYGWCSDGVLEQTAATSGSAGPYGNGPASY